MKTPGRRLWWYYFKSSSHLESGLGLGICGTLSLMLSVFLGIADHEYAVKGVETQATITRLEAEPGRRTAYWAYYRFQAGKGKVYDRKEGVSEAMWKTLRVGGALPIEYLQDRPASARLATGQDNTFFYVCWVSVSLFMTIIGWLMLASIYRTAAQRVRVLRGGVPALGDVWKVSAKDANPMATAMGRGTRYHYHLKYVFTDETGTKHEGESSPLPADRLERWHVGSSVLVSYDPSHPDKHEVDVLDVRTDDLLALLPQQD